MNESPKLSLDFKSLILLWAFAESGIGGLLHALRLPFTGIFAGGIAVVCIALLGYFQEGRKSNILEALAIVLMVKLAVSPHSPWQAYVAVIFQGYLGYWIFKNTAYFKIKVLVFAIICLMESALQKVLLAYLIFGNDFLKSIDQAALSIAKSIGITADVSVVFLVFGTYICLHLVTGIILGLWIPVIPAQLLMLNQVMPEFDHFQVKAQIFAKKKTKNLLIILIVFIAVLLLLKWLIPDVRSLELIWIFMRTILISVALIFIVGPFVRHFVNYKWGKTEKNKIILEDTIRKIPQFSQKAIGWLSYVNSSYNGWDKWKYFVLGLLLISTRSKSDNG